MPLLSDAAVASRLAALPDWQLEADQLVRTFTFEDFRAAVSFVNELAMVAEEANHHPDIDIRYNRVRLSLSTHSAGGLTAKDFTLATAIDKLL